MAQYQADFSGETLGSTAVPTGWTHRWDAHASFEIVADAAAPGGKALRLTQGGSALRSLLSLDEIDADANRDVIEVAALIRTTLSGTAITDAGIVMRGSGTSTTETGPVCQIVHDAGQWRIRFVRYLGGTGGNTSNDSAVVTSGLYWLVFRVANSGTVFYMDLYDASDLSNVASHVFDPGTNTGVGWAGLFLFSQNTTFDCLDFLAATNGDRVTLYVPGAGGGDTQEPTLSSPTATSTGTETASGTVSTDEANGSLYWIVTESATSPTPAQVEGGLDHLGAGAPYDNVQPVSATGVQNVVATGLSSATTYYIHYMHKDAAGNQSAVATSPSFTTSASGSGAQYSEDWSGESIGSTAKPAGWTERWDAGNTLYEIVADADAPAGKALRFTSNGNVRQLLSFDAIDTDANRDNIQQAILIKFSAPSASSGPSLCARASGTSTTETGIIGQTVDNGGHKLNVYRYSAGASQTSNLDTDLIPSVPTIAWLRFTVADNNSHIVELIDASNLSTVVSHTVADATLDQLGWAGIFTFTSPYSYDVLEYLAATGTETVTLRTVGGVATKGVTVTVYEADGTTPAASLTGIFAEWWDTDAPAGAATGVYVGLSTDASGVLTLDIDSETALALAGTGTLLLYKHDVATPENSLVYMGEETVVDIS